MSITSLSSEISRLTRDIADLQKKRGDIARKRSDIMAKVDRAQRAMASAKDLRKAADQAKALSGLFREGGDGGARIRLLHLACIGRQG